MAHRILSDCTLQHRVNLFPAGYINCGQRVHSNADWLKPRPEAHQRTFHSRLTHGQARRTEDREHVCCSRVRVHLLYCAVPGKDDYRSSGLMRLKFSNHSEALRLLSAEIAASRRNLKVANCQVELQIFDESDG